eukprot:TRINITY_DN6342_c0_g1_i1.p1 TRINITY_DN6342_c0_g1~~TRINITY_DN6342_c0_g1_i1.p1  ORF type:complete len:296 (-),score=79.35 TRINITY_DN6342_c0_g1_i1:156-968(-)
MKSVRLDYFSRKKKRNESIRSSITQSYRKDLEAKKRIEQEPEEYQDNYEMEAREKNRLNNERTKTSATRELEQNLKVVARDNRNAERQELTKGSQERESVRLKNLEEKEAGYRAIYDSEKFLRDEEWKRLDDARISHRQERRKAKEEKVSKAEDRSHKVDVYKSDRSYYEEFETDNAIDWAKIYERSRRPIYQLYQDKLFEEDLYRILSSPDSDDEGDDQESRDSRRQRQRAERSSKIPVAHETEIIVKDLKKMSTSRSLYRAERQRRQL